MSRFEIPRNRPQRVYSRPRCSDCDAAGGRPKAYDPFDDQHTRARRGPWSPGFSYLRPWQKGVRVRRVVGVESIESRDRRLRIAVIAPPWYSLPPRGYGGVELVVTLLARELRRRGHLVTLFGAEGSEIGTTVCAPPGLDVHLGQATQVLHEMTYLARVERMLRLLGPFEVISDHAGFGGALVSSLFDTTARVLHTVHGPIGVSELEFFDSLPAHVRLIAISGSQRSQAPRLQWAGVVHNAVDLDGLYVSPADRDPRYLLCLARICEDKGQDVAIEVARRCGLPLILAGKVEQTPASRAFFRNRVEPFIDGAQVRYLPTITGVQKARLIAGANCDACADSLAGALRPFDR